MSLRDKKILLIVSGGIAAYKTPDLVRRLRERGAHVRCLMTEAAGNFITPTTLAAVSGVPVATDLFEPIAGADVGHIRIARDADLIIVAPATADFMARMALGLSNDLAAAVLLACNCPVLIAPAMNPSMWHHAATQRNAATLKRDGVLFIGPETGEWLNRAKRARAVWPSRWLSWKPPTQRLNRDGRGWRDCPFS